MHRLDGSQILINDRFKRSATVVDISLDPSEDADIGIGININTNVHQVS